MTGGFEKGGVVKETRDGADGIVAQVSPARYSLVLSEGSPRTPQILAAINAVENAGFDVVVVPSAADQLAELARSGEPAYVVWTSAPDPRSRMSHERFAGAVLDWPEAVMPPPDLGRFNCRGEYVWPGMPRREPGAVYLEPPRGPVGFFAESSPRRLSKRRRRERGRHKGECS